MNKRHLLFFLAGMGLIAVLIIGTVIVMAIPNPFKAYSSRTPRVLHLELAAPLDQVIISSGIQSFNNLSYQSKDRISGLSMDPMAEPSMSPVIIRYGFPTPLFELPPSTFVNVSLQTAHVNSIDVKPMLKPLVNAESLELAKKLIKMFDESTLVKVTGKIYSLEEVELRMKLLAKDMDKQKFKIGAWKREEQHGTTSFSLSIEVLNDRNITDPKEQLYSLDLFIFDDSDVLEDKLETLRLTARTKIHLTDNGKPCTEESFSCDIPDVREYLDTLRKEKLIPLR